MLVGAGACEVEDAGGVTGAAVGVLVAERSSAPRDGAAISSGAGSCSCGNRSCTFGTGMVLDAISERSPMFAKRAGSVESHTIAITPVTSAAPPSA